MDFIAYHKAYNLAFNLTPYAEKQTKKPSPLLIKNYKFNIYRQKREAMYKIMGHIHSKDNTEEMVIRTKIKRSA